METTAHERHQHKRVATILGFRVTAAKGGSGPAVTAICFAKFLMVRLFFQQETISQRFCEEKRSAR